VAAVRVAVCQFNEYAGHWAGSDCRRFWSVGQLQITPITVLHGQPASHHQPSVYTTRNHLNVVVVAGRRAVAARPGGAETNMNISDPRRRRRRRRQTGRCVGSLTSRPRHDDPHTASGRNNAATPAERQQSADDDRPTNS